MVKTYTVIRDGVERKVTVQEGERVTIGGGGAKVSRVKKEYVDGKLVVGGKESDEIREEVIAKDVPKQRFVPPSPEEEAAGMSFARTPDLERGYQQSLARQEDLDRGYNYVPPVNQSLASESDISRGNNYIGSRGVISSPVSLSERFATKASAAASEGAFFKEVGFTALEFGSSILEGNFRRAGRLLFPEISGDSLTSRTGQVGFGVLTQEVASLGLFKGAKVVGKGIGRGVDELRFALAPEKVPIEEIAARSVVSGQTRLNVGRVTKESVESAFNVPTRFGETGKTGLFFTPNRVAKSFSIRPNRDLLATSVAPPTRGSPQFALDKTSSSAVDLFTGAGLVDDATSIFPQRKQATGAFFVTEKGFTSLPGRRAVPFSQGRRIIESSRESTIFEAAKVGSARGGIAEFEGNIPAGLRAVESYRGVFARSNLQRITRTPSVVTRFRGKPIVLKQFDVVADSKNVVKADDLVSRSVSGSSSLPSSSSSSLSGRSVSGSLFRGSSRVLRLSRASSIGVVGVSGVLSSPALISSSVFSGISSISGSGRVSRVNNVSSSSFVSSSINNSFSSSLFSGSRSISSSGLGSSGASSRSSGISSVPFTSANYLRRRVPIPKFNFINERVKSSSEGSKKISRDLGLPSTLTGITFGVGERNVGGLKTGFDIRR